MISNQLLQKTVDEIKSIVNEDLAVFEPDGKVAVRTFRDKEIDSKKIADFASSSREYKEISDFQLLKIKDDSQLEYILAVRGSSSSTELIGRMAKYQIETMIAAYREKFDKDNFIKSLLLDNLMLVDIFERSKKLHVELEVRRVAFLVELQNKNQDDAIGTLKMMFTDATDFVTALDKKTIVVVKQLDKKVGEEELAALARKMHSAIKSDISDDAIIAYGTIVDDLKDVSKSFKEAKMAQEVGKIFFTDRKVNSYNKLGIGRLIYQLPMPLCKLFINEIFKDVSLADFDDETIETINKFFENSLNVSETSRQLFIHRNTLVYRLDKIQKITGLDLRVFDDAITFKIALMVSNYMQYVEGLDFK
ncbi:MAG: helix-turn-helix domain-containing protein [Lachnospiraceae bacterium]|nr:helix-turn-helix domain-containing protein [Lachnospiraceae bacterium]